MMRMAKRLVPVLVVVLTAGCVTVPAGPSVTMLPTPGKPYDLFLAEDAYCRQTAEQRIGIAPQEVANQNTATGAIIGTAVGTGLGAAIGAASGNVGAGAVIGGVSGLLVGSAAGSDAGRVEGRQAQRLYDTVYLQCMYSHGNHVYNPGQRYYRRRAVIVNRPESGYDGAPPDYYAPYPPPNTPPPGPSAAPPAPYR
jgi:outer membrane lipoprotein SlyB